MNATKTVSNQTPGPWFHAPLSDDICAARGVPVACPPENYDAAWAANAPLIAAAPELRSALSAFMAFTSYVLGKRGSCVTDQHLFLNDEDMANGRQMLADASALLAKTEGR